MTIYYVTFMKHAEKVARNAGGSRPVLNGVYHDEEGNLAVTDSHRLYFAEKVYAPSATSIIKAPKTGEVIQGNYPNVVSLIPNKDGAKYVTEINVKEALEVGKAMGVIAKMRPSRLMGRAKLIGTKEGIASFQSGEEKALVTYELESTGEDLNMSFQIQYFVEALAMFKEAGHTQIKLRFYGNMKPFTLSDVDDQLIALLMPVRSYDTN